MLGGMDIITVEPGTVIEADGEELTVTETEAVIRGRSVYVTEGMADALRARSLEKET